MPSTSPVETHLRAEDRVDFREHVEREHGFLDAEVRDLRAFLRPRLRKLPAQHDLRRDAGPSRCRRPSRQRHRAATPADWPRGCRRCRLRWRTGCSSGRRPSVRGRSSGVLLDGLDVLRRDADRRDDAGGVAGMDAGQLDVLHDRRDEGVVCRRQMASASHLDGVLEELVDEDRPLRGYSTAAADVLPSISSS